MGLYIDRSLQPAWAHRVISDIQESGFATLSLVMTPSVASAPSRSRRPPGLFDLYSAVDRRVFGGGPATRVPSIRPDGEPPRPDASAPCDVGGLLREAARMPLPCSASEARCRLPEATVDAIVEYALDVVLSLVPDCAVVSEQPIARHGAWSFRFGDGQHGRTPPGFWEVFERSPVTASALVLTLEGSGEQVALYRSVASTDKYSVTRNANALWTTAAFVPRLLRTIHDGKLPAREDLVRDEAVPRERGARRGPPGNVRMARLLLKHGTRVAADRLRHKLAPERWVMAYSLGGELTPLREYQPLDPPGQRMWADPFPVRHDGTYWLFFEEQDRPGVPAHIAVMRMADDGTWESPVRVLECDHHLSYPFVFEWGGAFYMLPETAAANRVELYRASRFPYEWELDRVLVDDIRAFDVTLTQRDERWWMFLNSAQEYATNSDELHLYSAPGPLGPWQPHAANPVRIDARDTRSAGHIFQRDGRLLRPTQDCGDRYGRAISFNEIIRLDDEGLQEREVERIEPDWDPAVACVHTFNSVGDLTVIDCLRRERRFPQMPAMTIKKGGRHATSP